jgi:hypothetical protein
MNTLRKTLTIALTVATLGLGAISTAPDASAHGHHGHPGHHHHPGHHFGHHGGHGFGRVGHRFGWAHRRHGRGFGHHWGYHWGGYRRSSDEAVCPAGEHLGYLGKHCWPNRR